MPTAVARLLEKYFPTVARKIAFAVSLVLMLFGTTFIIVAQQTGSSLILGLARLQAVKIADLVNVIVEHEMLEGQPGHARQVLSHAASMGLVRNAYFLSNAGVVLHAAVPDSGPNPEIMHLEALPGRKGEKYYSTIERGSMIEFIVVPVIKKKECYRCHSEPTRTQGYFAMKVVVDDLSIVAAGHRFTNILMTIGMFLGLGGVLYLAVAAIVLRPIRRLHVHLRDVRVGLDDLQAGGRVVLPILEAPPGSDEIAALLRDYNRLVGRLNDAYASLAEVHSVQLEHADRLASTGQMAASMAHEIKNPLAGVLGALQVFESELKEKDERREIIGEMKLQLERVNHAVNDLLAYARPAPPVFEPVAFHPLIERTLTLLRRQAQESGIEVRLDFPDDGVLLNADPKQLQQVFWNVLINGLQSMEGGGVLAVATRVHGRQVEILVADTGKGVAPEHLGRIFEPFFTTRHRGTGLGMTISRRIIEQHHGRIDVASTVGKGTTVRIRMPVHRPGEGT